MKGQCVPGHCSSDPNSTDETDGRKLRLVDFEPSGGGRRGGWASLHTELGQVLTLELAWAGAALDLPEGVVLVAALARAIGRTIGDGEVDVVIAGVGLVRVNCVGGPWPACAQLLGAVRDSVAGARQPGPDVQADLGFAYGSCADAATLPVGHLLALTVYPGAGIQNLVWSYRTDLFMRVTIEELAEQLPLALAELTAEVVAR